MKPPFCFTTSFNLLVVDFTAARTTSIDSLANSRYRDRFGEVFSRHSSPKMTRHRNPLDSDQCWMEAILPSIRSRENWLWASFVVDWQCEQGTVLLEKKISSFKHGLTQMLYHRLENMFFVVLGVGFRPFRDENQLCLPSCRNSGPNHHRGGFLSPADIHHLLRGCSKNPVILTVEGLFNGENWVDELRAGESGHGFFSVAFLLRCSWASECSSILKVIGIQVSLNSMTNRSSR